LHSLGAVLSEDHDEHGWHLTVDLALADAQRLAAQAGGHPLETLLPAAEAEDWRQ
jgi:GTP-binding protein HflX